MKKLLLILSCAFLASNSFSQYTTCAAAAAAANMNDGDCLTGLNASTAVPAANCGGGFNSGVGFFFPFSSDVCEQFDFIASNDNEYQFRLWSSTCSLIHTVCSENTANVPFTWDPAEHGVNLNPGFDFVLEIVFDTPTTLDVCFTNTATEDPSNECAGAAGATNTPTTYYNGGLCEFSGSLNDATTSDPAANLLCAGSLENTQWISFTPAAGATSAQIIGTNISCSGGACAWQFGIASGTCASLTWEGCVSNGNACVNGPDPNNALTGSTTDGFALSWSGVSATGFTGTLTPSGGGAFTGTETFYLVMDGNAGADCQYTLSGTNLQPLPIELISFAGHKYNNANKIIWEVASELNNDYFTVERSTDGLEWREIGSVDGSGTSDTQKKYAVQDNSFTRGINYYRLKQTDFDGSFEYSKIISIDNTEEVEKTLIQTVNTMGQVVDGNYSGVVIDIYSDGTSTKRIQ